jgi:TolA-binding protein
MKKVMLKNAFLVLSFFIFLSACQNGTKKTVSPKSNSLSSVAQNAKALEQEQKLKEQEENIQDLKDQNRMVFAKKNQKGNAETVKSSAALNVIDDVSPTLSVLPKTDFEIYQDLQLQFERNNQAAFFKRFNLMKKNFPKSHFMDESLYLSGLMSLSNKNYAGAIKYFNSVIKSYPSSSKVPSSIFAKGVAFKRMNLKDEARATFVSVKKKYPGSVEARRAEGELKILKK